MGGLPSRSRALAFAAAASLAGAAPGQELARIPAPSPNQWTAALTAGALPNPSYEDASGQSNELPFTLDLYQARFDLTYGLSARVSAGAFLTYRENRYCCDVGHAITSRGISGFGAMLDYRPGQAGSGAPLLRLEYERAARWDGSLLPVSDGQDHVRTISDWRLLGPRGAFAGVDGRLDLDFAFGRAQPKDYYGGNAGIASGFVLASSDRLGLTGATTFGYVLASDDRENGTAFHNRRSSQLRTGAELVLALGRERRNLIRLDAAHDFSSRNALSGWRFGLNLRRSF